jgi:hypothetical protein
MTKDVILKAYPGIPSDAELGIFLFYGTIHFFRRGSVAPKTT